jgi:nicotinate-nucleotide adenylyltransferase
MRVGLFGGTFDPIHNAHLEIARAATQQAGLDCVYFIPSGTPPHREAVASFTDRYRMVEIACAVEPRFRPSRLEEGPSKNYSVDTVERFHAANPGTPPLVFIIGADAFAEIKSWHHWKDLARLVTFAVATRPGAAYDVPAETQVIPVTGVDLPVSSSEIRRRIREGSASADVPSAVLEYIREHHLYAT